MNSSLDGNKGFGELLFKMVIVLYPLTSMDK